MPYRRDWRAWVWGKKKSLSTSPGMLLPGRGWGQREDGPEGTRRGAALQPPASERGQNGSQNRSGWTGPLEISRSTPSAAPSISHPPPAPRRPVGHLRVRAAALMRTCAGTSERTLSRGSPRQGWSQHAPGTGGLMHSRGSRWSLKNCGDAEIRLHVGFSDNSQPYFRFLRSAIKAVTVNY